MNDQLEIKEIIETFYKIISGNKGDKRDWDYFRSLFFENAQLMSVKLSMHNECISIPLDVESYILRLSEFLHTCDFYEYGLNYEIKVINNIAQVYSSYEAKTSLKDSQPIKEGINLVQLVKTESSWKIVNMIWQDK